MRNYLIIGGSSGIGKELVKILEKQNANVFASYCTNPMQSTENINYFKLDVNEDELALNNLPEEIHGIAYCPGAINLKPFTRIKEDEFLSDYKFQVLGAVRIIQKILPNLKKAENSSVLLFSTIAVQSGFNYHTQVAMSKGAIEGLTRSLAAELAPNVRVNAVAPSLTNTGLANRFLNTEEKIKIQSENNPLKKIGDPKDVAEAAAFLLTPNSSWITGQVIHIDGGYSVVK
ncbi:MAG: oxidoreductase [Flavobacteriales bacterium]|nr:oxidoreductase [Flavobacteriales bacterium]|tara:strand:+ start:47 stop:739 length:693 start_codon:yes stop_codon:yes gene_type:complete